MGKFVQIRGVKFQLNPFQFQVVTFQNMETTGEEDRG